MAQTGIFQQRSAMTLNLDEQTWFKVSARFTLFPKDTRALFIKYVSQILPQERKLFRRGEFRWTA